MMIELTNKTDNYFVQLMSIRLIISSSEISLSHLRNKYINKTRILHILYMLIAELVLRLERLHDDFLR